MTAESSAAARPLPHPAVVLATPRIAPFLRLLQQGVAIRCRVGCSVETFLREELGASQETIRAIQSVMLDGRPVDDIADAVVPDGATLALSAALPGLVGATLRRGGTYSSFRGGITHHEAGGARAPREGQVTVKLFNLIMAELGPGLLRRGVLVRAADFLDLLAELPLETWQGGVRTVLDGKPVPPRALKNETTLRGAGLLSLSVSQDPAGR